MFDRLVGETNTWMAAKRSTKDVENIKRLEQK
jgi:hypothetical protein